LFVTVKAVKLTLEADDLRIFGDSMSASDHAGIGIRGIRLIVVAPKNIVECISAEAGQPDLPAILHVVLLVDVVPGHAASDSGIRSDIRSETSLGTDARYKNDVSSGGLHSTASSCSPGEPEAGKALRKLIYKRCIGAISFSLVALSLDRLDLNSTFARAIRCVRYINYPFTLSAWDDYSESLSG